MKTYDFKDGNGPVAAHKHPNGGGWVADSAFVEPTAYVGPNALVYGSAEVFGDALVSGDAKVFGSARVLGEAEVSGNATVKHGSHTRTPTSVTRSDGYTFTLQDGYIVAGCRDFTLKEAKAHWCNPEHHLYQESRDIFKFLLKTHKRDNP